MPDNPFPKQRRHGAVTECTPRPAEARSASPPVANPVRDEKLAEAERRHILARLEQEIPRLRRYARFLVVNASDADDTVQQCLAQAVANIDQWQPGSNLTAWLFVILRNVVYSDNRRSRRRPLTLGLEDWDQATGVSGGQEEALMLSALERAIHGLPPEQRDVILLVGAEGLSYEEAAEVLRVPVGTVRSRLSRARLALRELMDGTQSLDSETNND